MLSKIIKNFIAKMVAGRADDGIMITLKDPKKVEFQGRMLEDLLMRNGIDPNAIQTEEQLKNILNQIKAAEAQAIRNTDVSGIKNAKSAKIFDLEGKEIPKGSQIMGGKEVENTTGSLMSVPNKKGLAGMEYETDAAIKTRLEKGNKETTQRIKNRKMVKDAIDNASPGFVKGDRKYNAQLVADDLAEKKFGKDFYDLDQKQQMDLYGEALDGLSEDFAQGGIARLGLKEGSGMTRRTFLKLLGGMAAVPIVGKFFKLAKVGKTVTKVPMIKTDDVAGKPEWFDALVNKVITEGDDVTKKFATGERQSIHQKTLDDGSVVRVTEDVDDGAVRVEYQNEQNVYGDDVLLQYKKPLPDEGDPRPTAQFDVAESGPVGRQSGPDDFDLDVDEVGGTSISDLDSDVSKLKEYATGKKPTMKEFVQNKKRRDKASAITNDIDGAASDAVIRRQGEALDYDDYASGGIARMLGE